MEILETSRARYPEVQLTLSLAATAEVLESLFNFETDIGVLGRALDDPCLYSMFYNRQGVLVMVHTNHPFAARRSLRIRDLEGQEVVLRSRVSTTRQERQQSADY